MASRLEAAIELALFAHQGQKDAQGVAYILHPLRVMEACRQRNANEEQMIAAVLHDVIEDTDVDEITIRRRFGDYVARMVVALSRKVGPGYEEPYNEFIYRILDAGNDTVTIKECDIRDNYGRLDGITDPAKRERLRLKYEKALQVIAIWRSNRGI